MQLPSEYLGDLLRVVGERVGTHPTWYIAVTATAALFLSTGILHGGQEIDMDLLFFDFTDKAAEAWRFQDEHFPVNYSAFQPDRLPHIPATGDIIFEPKYGNEDNKSSMLDEEILREILDMESRVRNLIFEFMGRSFGYEDVCARWNGSCYETATTRLLTRLVGDVVGRPDGRAPSVDWPLFVTEDADGGGFDEIYLPEGLGSVQTDAEGVARRVGAVKSTFYLNIGDEYSTRLSRAWQVEFRKFLKTAVDDDQLRVTKIVYNDDQRVHRLFADMPAYVIKNRLVISYTALTLFSALAFMTGSWTTSKPLLGLVAVLACGLATGATFGTLLFVGFEHSALLAAIPFISLAVGIDDAFVIVAAWHMTDKKLSVPERLAGAYSEAAVSITITSLTDVIAFAVGSFMPLRGLSDFCLFTAVSMALVYVYILLFFGGFLAITGKHEAEGRHCLTFKVIESHNSAANKSTKEVKAEESAWKGATKTASQFVSELRLLYVEFLHTKFAKIFICTTFVAYLAGACYGMANLKVVVDWKTLVPRNDMYVHYVESLETHFLEFPTPIQVMLGGNLKYSDKKVQGDIERMLRTLESSEHFRDALYTQSWLRGFLSQLQNRAAIGVPVPANFSTEESFVRYLQEEYLQGEANEDALDVQIENGSIKASRFLLLPAALPNSNSFPNVVGYLRSFFTEGFPDYIVHHINPMYIRIGEQGLRLLSTTYKSLAFSIIGICLATLLLGTRLTCSAVICATTCTVMLGLMGYFQLMGHNYDSAMTASMIMSIGFSVDYSAHFAFTFTGSRIRSYTSRERLDYSLKAVGGPILLGAVTSLIGLCGFINAPSRSYETFFYVMCGVVVLGLYHGLVVLPVVLLLVEDAAGRCFGDPKITGADQRSVSDQKKSPKQKRSRVVGHIQNVVVEKGPVTA